MGNTSSQEAPRASSRKLSKPRVIGRDRPRDLAVASAPVSELAIHHTEASPFSNSYLVGVVPILASQRTPADIVSPGPANAVLHDDHARIPSEDFADDCKSPTNDPKSPPQAGFNELLRPETMERRCSTSQGSVSSNGLPSRTPSRQDIGGIIQMSGRTPSVHMTSMGSNMTDADFFYERPIPRSQSVVERRASLHWTSHSGNGGPQDAVYDSRRNSSTVQHEETPPHRTQSESSLYPPHRRRSLILTPGVATRSEGLKTLRRKESFRRSMEPTPSVSRETSAESKASRHLSLPVMPSKSNFINRFPTSSEAEYKQLGVMRFGTLRITNGAPTPSPGQEHDEATLYAPEAVNSDVGKASTKGAIISASQSHQEVVPVHEDGKGPTIALKPASPRSPAGTMPIIEGHDNSPQISPRSPRIGAQNAEGNHVPPMAVRPPTSELQRISKHPSIDDQLFGKDDTSQTEMQEPVSQIIEKRRELDVGIQIPPRPSLVHVSRNDSGYVSNSSKSSRKTLSAGDSCCSSTTSMRSLQQQRGTIEGSDYMNSVSHETESNGSSPLTELSSNGAISVNTEDVATPLDERLRPSIYSRDDASLSTPRTSTSSTTLSISRLPSLRLSKSREQKEQSRKSPNPDQPGRRKSLLQTVSSPVVISSPSSNGHKPSRMSSLRRLLSSGSRKNLATSYAVHEFDEGVPSVPSAVEEKLQGHSAQFPTAPKRLALRVEPSQDSLGTIMSVEDTLEPGGAEGTTLPKQPVQPTPKSRSQRESMESTRLDRRISTRLSISSVSGSISGAATSILSPKSSSNPRNFIRRRSTMDGRKSQRPTTNSRADEDSDEDVVIDGNLMDNRDFMVPNGRHSGSHGAYDQALPGSGDQGRYPVRENQNWMKEPYVDPRASRREPQLRNRKSAPDVRQTMAGHLSPVFERDSVMASVRTPPPVSIHTRGSKKRRSLSKASRRQTSPAGVSQYRHLSSSDSLNSVTSCSSSSDDLSRYPHGASSTSRRTGQWQRAAPLPQQGPYPFPQWAVPPKEARPLFSQRYSYDGSNAPPMQPRQSGLAPMPSRQQDKDHWLPNRHREPQQDPRDSCEQNRNSRPSPSRNSDGPEPPFRVLHSYNSPAYKGIPIWG